MAESLLNSVESRQYIAIRSGTACPACGSSYHRNMLDQGRCACGTLIFAATQEQCSRDAFAFKKRIEDARRRYHTCACCGKAVEVEETVWVNPTTREATVENGSPYHVECAPGELP